MKAKPQATSATRPNFNMTPHNSPAYEAFLESVFGDPTVTNPSVLNALRSLKPRVVVAGIRTASTLSEVLSITRTLLEHIFNGRQIRVTFARKVQVAGNIRLRSEGLIPSGATTALGWKTGESPLFSIRLRAGTRNRSHSESARWWMAVTRSKTWACHLLPNGRGQTD